MSKTQKIVKCSVTEYISPECVGVFGSVLPARLVVTVNVPSGYKRVPGVRLWCHTALIADESAVRAGRASAAEYAAWVDGLIAERPRTPFDLAAVSVGLDWLEDTRPELTDARPDADADPAACVYVRYCDGLASLLAARLPHVRVRFTGLSGEAKCGRWTVRPVFSRVAVEALLSHVWPFGLCHLRPLSEVNKKYWRVIG